MGAAYAGVCRVRTGVEHEPSEEHQREWCNCGYARGRCAEFPADAAADAVRFSMAGGKVVYILEKDHAPMRHGRTDEDGVDELLRSQARAFVESQG